MFEFDYTLDTSVALAGRKMLKKYCIIIYIVLPLIVSSEYFIKFFQTGDYAQLTRALIFFVLFYSISFVVNKFSKKIANKNNKNFLNQNVNILFSDSKIIVKTKKEGCFESSQEYEWNMIYKFAQDKSYYFIYLSRFKSYVIPKESCINGNEAEFASYIMNKLEEKNT